MSKTAQVVDGEASESDTEVELGQTPDLDLPRVTKPFVIAGEAPESDEELSNTFERVERPPLSPVSPKTPQKHQQRFDFSSLLHQKLWESNVSLRTSLDTLLKQTTDSAIDKLSKSDKALLSVQESMRSVNANLTLARARLKQISVGFDNANCATALPTVKIK